MDTSPSLLCRARARDEQAWVRLVHLYSPLVRHWCARGGVARDDAQDVVQEVLLAVSRSLDQFHPRRAGSFRAWVRGITRHKLLDHHRRGRHPGGAGGSEALLQLHDIPGRDQDEDPAQIGDLYRRALDLVRGEFEARTWEAFWSCVVEGRPTAVVAEALGMSAVAVRIARSRVLGRLREEVGDLEAFDAT